ncbi:lytic polysaccharide monooxygenase auxiliary activity family 9 protein [Streptomyces sp. NPDC005811]|uniref:lytic polysaccharide monooxygenase auxiliary activity family 9 protein n=1 Tax=Streptomyces sp. NPDC005811 TaxID=3154565 RepID=UPI0033F5B390
MTPNSSTPVNGDYYDPKDLTAATTYRSDGSEILHGISLRWTTGGNSGGDTTPPDWDEGRAPYPHVYEVWLNGQPAQTLHLDWPTWWGGWKLAANHWVTLGTDPGDTYQVRIRARRDDGSWSPFSEECTVPGRADDPYQPIPVAVPDDRGGDLAQPRHGNMADPPGRSVLTLKPGEGDKSHACTSAFCDQVRAACASDVWWAEVVPGKERMCADYPWNRHGHYLEYRKFSAGGDDGKVASAGNPRFAGLDLVGDWPTTALDSGARDLTFSYEHTASHIGPTWTYQFFVTRDGWNVSAPLSWADLEPTPFMVVVHGRDPEQAWTTAVLAGRKTGRHAIVNVWGGHGGVCTTGNPERCCDHIDQEQQMTGEFFVSVSDVVFE